MKLKWFTVGLTIIIALVMQACGKRIEPQEDCHFIQNDNLQRVSWKGNIPIKLYVHSSVPKEYYPEINAAINVWNSTLNRQIFRIEAYGTSGALQPKRDGYSVIYWFNNWESHRPTEQARTTVYWTGTRIYEGDIRINDKNFNFYGNNEDAGGKVHLESLFIHELGHVLGLAHNEAGGSVMSASLANDLERDDIGAVDQKSALCEY